ncbi:protein tyrosine kinase domain-containing protein [Ditylenchus destructor]|uniref:receptor protein-tyrosine kinase n=1 Tax=Ditylenchus destructor TaxID=166010 RepID=A0AAD4MP75_9BILA|nr:protein tyrosine kinase domain-containing protein [Ditylenchus destructor]
MFDERSLRGWCVTLWPALVIILANIQQTSSARNETRCGSIDIRNNPRMAFQPKHRDCTIMEGDLALSLITQDDVTDYMFPVFENLREITGSMLVFEVNGLLSLGRMFPNLRVIGGHSLIMNYALVIYQNQHLRDVGLTKLTTIKNGGVRIAENPRLCYARSINWDVILRGKIRGLIIDEVAGHCKSECTVKGDSNCLRDVANYLPYCWNATHCQTACPNVEDSGCTDDGQSCHTLCMGGCSIPDDPGACHSCRGLDVDGICVKECPGGMYEQLGRRCLTEKECHDLHPVTASPRRNDKSAWKTFGNQCHYVCPNDFQEDPNNPHRCIQCTGYCPKKCSGDTVDSIGSAMKFSKCNMIEGNLELDMRIGMEFTSAEKFSEAFGDIEEITGYLLIRFSSAFMSLHMFKKLRAGRRKVPSQYSRYALVVFENQNLHQLFNLENKQLQIIRGKVCFQNNRMLCYNKIEAFLEHVGLKENVTEYDVSPFSNGDKAICDEIPLEVKIARVYNYGFVVSWVPFDTSGIDLRKFLGYQIFYKKVDHEDPNMSVDDDRSACSDTWSMHFVTYGGDAPGVEMLKVDSQNSNLPPGRELINQGIEANTLYAVYVQTRFVNHPGGMNAISKIHFVRTTFGVPDPPSKKLSVSERFRESPAVSSDSLKLSWDPPRNANGNITHYIITWNLVTGSKPSTDVCNVKPSHQSHSNSRSSTDLVSSSNLQSSEDICPAIKSCCKCSQVNGQELYSNIKRQALEEQREEIATFEDALQNNVFVQKDGYKGIGRRPTNSVSQRSKKKRSLNSIVDQKILGKNARTYEELPAVQYHNLEELILSDSLDAGFNSTFGIINFTGTNLLLTGLPHYSEYHISIYACQDVRQIENYCSSRPLWTKIKTEAIPELDVIPKDSVVLLNVTNGKKNDKKIYWTAPETPNGYVLGYFARLIRDNGRSLEHRWSTEQCIPADDFERNNGISFYGLSDGRYTLEVRVVTSTNYHNNVTTVKDIFVIYTPGFFAPKVIAIIVAITVTLMVVSGVAVYHSVNRMFGKKVKEYVQQAITTNPEYLSQMDIYKADEWELKREDLILEREIGRGMFGKVFRGYGKDIHSVTGEVFGECAIKTVSETASNAERLHFLIEASVMKQFNTDFIVKLYGVVSDGQPVLVVMELMEKGNLRDFLRSHRPNAEENKEGRPVPTLIQYFTWASQIADGMAYLESLRFCHRDLAARNCMVHADESVKIGDFGMARDIYYQEYYKVDGKRLMPVRWMAPESLKDGKFSIKSDVWSYGIVIYEMLTLGQQPYAGLALEQVFNYIAVQRRVIPKSRECPLFWYKLMWCCWRYDPRERPSFHHIVRHLKQHTTDQFQKLSFVLNRLELPKEVDPSYDFDVDVNGDEQSKDCNAPDEFEYHQTEDEDTSSYSDDYLSDEDLRDPAHTPLCNDNRRPTNESISDLRAVDRSGGKFRT